MTDNDLSQVQNSSLTRKVLVGIGIAVLVVVMTLLFDWAAGQGLLIAAAAPLVIVPILSLCFLRPKEELMGWSVLTMWLSLTYLATEIDMSLARELTAFIVIVVLAILGYLRSSWILAAVWFLHIAWDFIPRELPEHLHDLPVACIIFDGLIGAYIAWRSYQGRWAVKSVVKGES